MLLIDSCPSDFCASPSVISVTSLQSFVSMNLPLPSRTRTRISFSFKTRYRPIVAEEYVSQVYSLLCMKFNYVH